MWYNSMLAATRKDSNARIPRRGSEVFVDQTPRLPTALDRLFGWEIFYAGLFVFLVIEFVIQYFSLNTNI